jgi:hypothetical protein
MWFFSWIELFLQNFWQKVNIYADKFTGVELDALRSTIQAVNARLKRHTRSPEDNLVDQRGQKIITRKSHVPEGEISQLKSSVAKLSLINSENTKKVKLVESSLRRQETSYRWHHVAASILGLPNLRSVFKALLLLPLICVNAIHRRIFR